MSDEVLRTAELLNARGITAIVRQKTTVVVVPAANGQHETRTVSIPEAASLIVQQIGNSAPPVELVENALIIIGNEAQLYDKIARERDESYDEVEDRIVSTIVYFLHGCLQFDCLENSLIGELIGIIYRSNDNYSSDAFPDSMYERILAGCSDKLRRAGINLLFTQSRSGFRIVELTRIPPCDECQKMRK